jgi:NADPH:quinone reductase-like Zn-dependent oxidoreductase
MKAVVQHSFGAPAVLMLREAARPVPLPTEILVRVRAAGVNPVDWQTRAGAGMSWALGEPPFTLGWDVSGVVEEVGFGVTTLTAGDEVYGMPWFPRAAGGYAEFVTAPSRQFARKPRSLSHEQAAAVPLAALTAWQTLVDTAHLQPGQRVLVHAAGGGVGHFAVQIAKHLGAHVIGTASSARHQWLHGLGADQLIDHTTVSFEDVLTDMDVVLDLVGDGRGNTSIRSLKVLRPGGLIIAVPGGVSPELAAAADAAAMRATAFLVEPDGTALTRIAELIDAGAIRVEVEEVFPLAEAARTRPRRIPPHPRQARPARRVLTPRPERSRGSSADSALDRGFRFRDRYRASDR